MLEIKVKWYPLEYDDEFNIKTEVKAYVVEDGTKEWARFFARIDGEEIAQAQADLFLENFALPTEEVDLIIRDVTIRDVSK